MCIKWGLFFSGKFHVTNGVRQGGVLSPLLFNVYVNELSECLNKSGIEGSMNSTTINHMFKGVFKGGFWGLNPPPPPRNFQIFLKSEGKEVERNRKKK